ncbi:hypothetical protein J2J97_31850 (plasmid) [Rhizobium bangladeshense]|uniref:deoxynucleotide monophosphate kinase family protein n=1 Tax=Rhizobium bangladeshense TaxID=1138189 RepID=UPI001A9938A7|nr:hypothetical protein [Rhizobium bangladeshense]QSY98666.1 hypothetical protein J2J97_31850 [Rhizobium bangladeshense]
MSKIIGLLGAKHAGKSEIAQYLVEHHGFTRFRFADGVKGMLKTLGLTEAQVDGDEKESPIPLLGGKRYRDAATSLGTGWGRNMMDDDLWVRACEQKILAHMLGRRDVRIIVDDVRYANECQMLRRYGATLCTVRRPTVEPHWNIWQKLCVQFGLYRMAGIHSSEVLYRLLQTDLEIWNEGDLAELHADADALAEYVPDEQLRPT